MTLRPLPWPPTQARCAPARLGILVCGWLGPDEEPLQVWLDAVAERQALGAEPVPSRNEEPGWGDALNHDEKWIVQGACKHLWSAGPAWRQWSVLRWEMVLLRQVGPTISSASTMSGGGVAWR